MSTFLDEKLAPAQRVANTKAQARLEQLLVRRGSPAHVDTRNPPPTLEVLPIACAWVEVWRRVGGSAGQRTVYELDHEREVLP